jgi:hypothetical protein
MLIEFPFPCIIRAKPPRCGSVRQVVTLLRVERDVPVLAGEELPIVAMIDDGKGNESAVRHDGADFYRRVCAIADLPDAFPVFMKEEGYLRGIYRKLMDDERMNPLEYSALTWPTKEQKKPRRLEPFETLLGFEELNGHDVIRCRDEAIRMAGDTRLHDDGVWIKCGEPCYRIGHVTSNMARIAVRQVFSDQGHDPRPDEAYMSALDRDAMVHEALRVAAGRLENPSRLADITVIVPEAFGVDFADRGFVRYATFILENIAAHMAQDQMQPPGTALLEASTDDLSLWLELRGCVERMRVADTAAAGDDDTVMRGADLWRRLGGNALRPTYLSAALFDHWQARVAQEWLDRPVRIAASATVTMLP